MKLTNHLAPDRETTLNRLTRITAAVASLGIATALAVAPAQASDTTEITAAPVSENARVAVSPAAPNETTYRKCVPAPDQPAQVRTCMYLYKDRGAFRGEAMVTDIDGGRNYSVLAVDLRIQAYLGGQWQLVGNTWKEDSDGWFAKRDYAFHSNWLECYGAGQTVPLRAIATIRYKLAGSSERTTVTRTSPSARTWCP
jgi:hypothetical protein